MIDDTIEFLHFKNKRRNINANNITNYNSNFRVSRN